VPTFGSRPGTAFVKSLGSNVVNPRGQIRIENTFQLKGHSNIYAIGDAIDWQEQKQAAKAPKHAQIAAANILSQINGDEPKKTYSGQPELIIITNGKVRCSSQSSPFHTFSQFVTSCRSRVSHMWACSGVSH
jgi:apoptosis-inducing factor 2